MIDVINMLNVIMLNVIVLNVIMLNVIMLNVIMLNVIMLNVIVLNVIMLSVMKPLLAARICTLKLFTVVHKCSKLVCGSLPTTFTLE